MDYSAQGTLGNDMNHDRLAEQKNAGSGRSGKAEHERQYRELMSFENLVYDDSTVAAFTFNVDTGRIERLAKGFDFNLGDGGPGDYMSAIKIIGQSVLPEYMDEFRYIFDIENIREAIKEGHSEVSMDYGCNTHLGYMGYYNCSLKFVAHPVTGVMMSMLRVRNITQQKLRSMIVDRIVEGDCDYIVILDASTGGIIMTVNNNAYSLPEVHTGYSDFLHSSAEAFVPEEREEALKGISLETVKKQLEHNEYYSRDYSVVNGVTGAPARKSWKFAYLNSSRREIIYSRRDITEIYDQAEKQNAALTAALMAAQQASAAKTDFLSRMSHEIRTPMNAIIGMTTIAAQSIGNEEKIAECISKIGISARFLLSLINDILDMSRIESGKMLLKNDKIPMDEFLTGINSICYTQASSKNVDYECVPDARLDDYYIGDAMKLQQVLINILSNGIKFTGAGGKVTFSIGLLERLAGRAVLRFTISDTGIGMSQEYIEKLFEPFSQEDTGTTTLYGGTGLGLAISKSIVDMMGGKISVQSIKGVGTEFTVDVGLGLTEETKRLVPRRQQVQFENLRTLVVDDDVVVCESTVTVLSDMGVTAEWIDSGAKAISRVQELKDRSESFDMILVDWKMPDMDGIETARRIRKIVGEEVTIIIVTAYDWAAIEHEAKLAGVNMLISKPAFKSTLVSAFSKCLGEKETIKRADAFDKYRFTGKRVLLVEDHPLNVEVACNLLSTRGFEIETAENGLRAIEMFSKRPAGYYDAILMDIRMPVMDGLQAAGNIRQMQNADAETIPIIAMTANAFEDDVEKSRAAGMNAHLAKPIEPQKLYRTLYNLIVERKD